MILINLLILIQTSSAWGGEGGESSSLSIVTRKPALAGVAQWIEHQPANQRVTGSIPNQGTCLA